MPCDRLPVRARYSCSRRAAVVDASRPNPDNSTRNYRSPTTAAGRECPLTATREIVTDRRDQYAFHDDIVYLAETKRGLSRETVEEISGFKGEPEWMLQARLRAYDHFVKRPMP